MTEAFKAPFLLEAIKEIEAKHQQSEKAQNQWDAEKAEIFSSIPKIRDRFGSLIRKHISFPNKVDGMDIKPAHHFDPEKDVRYDHVRVKQPRKLFATTKQLSPTRLDCETTLDEEKIDVYLDSSAYPFENWLGQNKQRDVKFTISIPNIDFSIELPQGNRIQVLDEDGQPTFEKLKLSQIKMLNEVLDLIENPAKTEYSHAPRIIWN